MLAIIGGSGMSRLAALENLTRKVARTPFGEPSGALTFGRIAGRELVFLARHGHGHTIAPHEVNYRANLWALRDAGVREVVSIASVGSIAPDLPPGALLVPDQIIDYTWGRPSTYYEGANAPVTHVDFTHPYTQALRARLLAAGQACGEALRDGGVYATTQGPRLETAAEINRLERDGAHVVGMTAMPEAVLARELELPYAAIAVVANHAAGRGGSVQAIRLDGIAAILEEAMTRVHRILQALIAA